jgi:hypothetical protein
MEDTIEHGVEARRWLARLDRIVAEMADSTRPLLESVTPARYRAVLSVCYHYTRASGAQLERAADLAPGEDLREFFTEMADEERDHFRLAEADLAALGSGVEESRPAAVQRFAEYWNGIGRANYFEFLGATYVLENLANRLREGATAALTALGLTRRQSRFLLTHLEADVEHGERVAELCARYAPERGPELFAGAEAAIGYWIAGIQAFLGGNAD